MTKQKIMERLQELLEDDEIFTDLVQELNSHNGILGDEERFPMDMLYDFFSHNRDSFENFIFRIFYGYDADTSNDSYDDNRHFEAFNPNRDYFYYNGYGNLVSTDYIDYSGVITVDELIDELVDNYSDIYFSNDEVEELVEKLFNEDYEEGGE